MTDPQFKDQMESMQFAGHPVKWYVHRRDHFSKKRSFYSRHVAETVAASEGLQVTPDFDS